MKDCQSAFFRSYCIETLHSWQSAISYMDLIAKFGGIPLDEKPCKDIAFQRHVFRTSDREANDPRDLIFGLMGLVGPRIRSMTPVDYWATEAAIFANTTAVACHTTDDERFWCTLMEHYSFTSRGRSKPYLHGAQTLAME